MKDRAGNELTIGDRVLYLKPGTSTSWLVWGTVSRFTAQKVGVTPSDKAIWEADDILRNPSSVVKPYSEPCLCDYKIVHDGEDE